MASFAGLLDGSTQAPPCGRGVEWVDMIHAFLYIH